MTIYHIHHITPRHMGGTDEPSNLIRLTIEEHAEAHRKLFETYNKPEDKLAWLALSGQLNMTEISREAQRIGSSRGGKIGGRIAGEKCKKENLGFLAKDTEWHKQKGLNCVAQQIGIHSPGFDKSVGSKIGGDKCRDEGLGFHAPGFDRGIGSRNTVWILKDGIERKCKDHELLSFIAQGWSAGRKPRLQKNDLGR